MVLRFLRYECAGLLKAEKDAGKGLRTLIAAAGGAVAPSLPKDFSGILLGDESALPKEQKWFKGRLAAPVPLFGRAKLLAAIMQQEFDREADVLATVS